MCGGGQATEAFGECNISPTRFPPLFSTSPSGNMAAAPAAPAPVDDSLKAAVRKIPLLSIRAGPKDGERWLDRLKQELKALISVCHHPFVALLALLVFT